MASLDKTSSHLSRHPTHHSVFAIGSPVEARGRCLLLAIAALLVVGLVVAMLVTPDERGFGTHERLGLSPCGFLANFGICCPTCGMTTSVAHFVRGQMMSSVLANPAGFVVAALSCIALPWSLISLFAGRTWLINDAGRVTLWVITALTASAVSQWLIRVLIPALS